MKRKKLLLSTFLLLGFGFIALHAQVSHTDIVPVGSTVKKLSSNQFEFGEGPVWYHDSILLFTSYRSADDKSQINIFNPIDNKFGIFRDNINANGLTCDKEGNLLSTDSHRVVMLNSAGVITKALATTFNSIVFNSPNDIIADNKGGVYFTDPIYFGIPTQDKEAVYYIEPAGNVKRVIDDLQKPNGVILSPDGSKLYVGDSNTKFVYSWDVASDGSISGKSIFAELQTINGVATSADGMAIDIYANLYVANQKGIQVFSPQGTYIINIAVPENAPNCDFGGKDFKTLYITGFTNLYSIDLNYPGYAVSRSVSTNVKNSISNKPLVEIYPNPVQNVLHVDLPVKTGVFEVVDITGKSVLQKEIRENNTSIDISGLVNGIYLVKVRSDNQLFTEKIVKN